MREPHVLIIGASGLVGTAAANSFLAAGWHVTAASRRAPELINHAVGERLQHLPLDLQDARATAAAIEALSAVTHVVYTAVYELPGLIAGWSDPHQISTNGQMLRNVLTPLRAHHPLEHVTLLQGTKAYGGAVRPMRIPARESQPRVEHPNFYWLQEDHLREAAAADGFAFTILRPQLIVGPNHGVVMNLPPVVGAYAALRTWEGEPCGFPGGADWVWEAVDVRLVGEACCWAATAPAARGETYNLNNGEVFAWRDMWPAIVRTLGAQPGPDEPLSVATYLNERHAMWDQLVAHHDLAAPPLAAFVGESHYYADLCFAHGAQTPPPPALVSSIRIKQAGFTDTCNSEESFCYWLADLQARRMLPSAKT